MFWLLFELSDMFRECVSTAEPQFPDAALNQTNKLAPGCEVGGSADSFSADTLVGGRQPALRHLILRLSN
jgi:hypothetical protein